MHTQRRPFLQAIHTYGLSPERMSAVLLAAEIKEACDRSPIFAQAYADALQKSALTFTPAPDPLGMRNRLNEQKRPGFGNGASNVPAKQSNTQLAVDGKLSNSGQGQAPEVPPNAQPPPSQATPQDMTTAPATNVLGGTGIAQAGMPGLQRNAGVGAAGMSDMTLNSHTHA